MGVDRAIERPAGVVQVADHGVDGTRDPDATVVEIDLGSGVALVQGRSRGDPGGDSHHDDTRDGWRALPLKNFSTVVPSLRDSGPPVAAVPERTQWGPILRAQQGHRSHSSGTRPLEVWLRLLAQRGRVAAFPSPGAGPPRPPYLRGTARDWRRNRRGHRPGASSPAPADPSSHSRPSARRSAGPCRGSRGRTASPPGRRHNRSG